MLKIVKKYIKIPLILIFTIIIFGLTNIKAATAGISASSQEVTVGTAVNVNVSINAASWNVKVTGAVSDSIVGYDDNASNRSTNKSYNLNTSAPGTYTVSISGDVTDQNGSNSDVGSSVTVVVKEKPVAQETTNNNNNYNSSNNTSNYTSKNNTNTSNSNSNANLRNLVVDQEGLSPMFSSSVTNYALTVPAKVTSLNIKPEVEQAGAKYWIEGDENLQMGENKVTITVTAPNGNKKTYTIVVNRVDDVSKADAALKSLIIDGIELDPEFSPETLEYNLGKFDSSVKKLTILAFANSDKAKVEILGNGNFKTGENEIKVVVTAEDNTTKKEYVLKLKMDEVEKVTEETNSYQYLDYEEPTRLQNFINNAKKNKLMLVMLLVMVIELIEIVILYKKLHSKDDDNDGDGTKVEASTDIEEKSENATDEVNVEEKEVRRRRAGADPEEENQEKEANEEKNEVEKEADVESDQTVEEKKEEFGEKENILNLENIDAVRDEIIEDQEKDLEENFSENTLDEKEEIKEATETEKISSSELPEIDFESLVKETLEKYESEEMKVDNQVEETPKKSTRGRKKST